MKQNISNKSIIVCSIVRNAEKGLIKNIPVIDKFCKQFADYKIIVYENDSTDKTKQLLAEWNGNNVGNIYVISENIDNSATIPKSSNTSANPFFSRKRIEKMAYLRNKYIEYIDNNHFEADYICVVDLDVAQIDYKGLLSSFNSDYDWDAVTAFGYSLSPKFKRRYHDSYALVEYGQENVPQTEMSIIGISEKYGNMQRNDNWVRVFSAFGGLAIYKFDAFKGLRYTVFDNRDCRVEVRCEHFSICKQMFERGFDKIYVNPGMRLIYQKVTLQLIINTIKRKFNS